MWTQSKHQTPVQVTGYMFMWAGCVVLAFLAFMLWFFAAFRWFEHDRNRAAFNLTTWISTTDMDNWLLVHWYLRPCAHGQIGQAREGWSYSRLFLYSSCHNNNNNNNNNNNKPTTNDQHKENGFVGLVGNASWQLNDLYSIDRHWKLHERTPPHYSAGELILQNAVFIGGHVTGSEELVTSKISYEISKSMGVEILRILRILEYLSGIPWDSWGFLRIQRWGLLGIFGDSRGFFERCTNFLECRTHRLALHH